MILYNVNHTLCSLTVLLGMFIFGGCSTEEDLPSVSSENNVSVRFEIQSDNQVLSRAPGDVTLSANRILILPFKKTNESLDNSAGNFTPIYEAAKQLNVSTFPAVSTMLNLVAASTYQILVIGYNRNDYDFANQTSASRRFNIGSVNTPITLDNFYLNPVSAVDVPEFFSCLGNAYSGSTLKGNTFKPGEINYVQGNLKRQVSGLSLTITGIPAYVSSVTLVAERLVTASKATDATPLQWQTAGDAGLKVFEKQIPITGQVSFNKFVLSTWDAHHTYLYLDVTYGIFTDRYTVKVPDMAGVSATNRITFTPNHWVKITGTYASINLGFTIAGNINLDDDSWDGIQ